MSLTRTIELPEVRDAFAAAFARPAFPSKKPAIVVPSQASNRDIAGTAYDYLFRLVLQDHLASRMNNGHKRKVQIIAPKVISSYRGSDDNDQKPFRIIHSEWIAQKASRLLKASKDVPRPVKAAAERIVETSNLLRFSPSLFGDDYPVKLIESCLQLAILDQVYRAGLLAIDLEVVDRDDALDIAAMIQHTDFNLFTAENVCLMNPELKAGAMVGGADADLVLDETLIDVKTSSAFEFPTKHFHQLLGYLVLSRLGGFEGIRGVPEIRRLGIYYARYNYLFTFPVEEVIQEKGLKAFCRRFKGFFATEKSSGAKSKTMRRVPTRKTAATC